MTQGRGHRWWRFSESGVRETGRKRAAGCSRASVLSSNQPSADDLRVVLVRNQKVSTKARLCGYSCGIWARDLASVWMLKMRD